MIVVPFVVFVIETALLVVVPVIAHFGAFVFLVRPVVPAPEMASVIVAAFLVVVPAVARMLLALLLVLVALVIIFSQR